MQRAGLCVQKPNDEIRLPVLCYAQGGQMSNLRLAIDSLSDFQKANAPTLC